MSRGGYERLAMEAEARNGERHQAAVEDLRRRGYTLVDVDDDIRVASLEDPGRTRCLDRAYGIDRLDAGVLPPDAPLRIQVGQMTRGGEQPKPPVFVVAPAENACAFFRQRGGPAELEVTKEDGSIGRLVPSAPRTLARGPNGELVMVDIRTKTVRTRKVLVDRTCDHMPRTEPDPLENPSPVFVQWDRVPKLRSVVMTIEREAIEVECTDHTY